MPEPVGPTKPQLTAPASSSEAVQASRYPSGILDSRACWDVVRHGAVASFMLDDRGQRMLDGTEQVLSVLDIFVKGMGLDVNAAREHGQPVPLAAAAQRLYLTGQARLGRHNDDAVIEVLRRKLLPGRRHRQRRSQ